MGGQSSWLMRDDESWGSGLLLLLLCCVTLAGALPLCTFISSPVKQI